MHLAIYPSFEGPRHEHRTHLKQLLRFKNTGDEYMLVKLLSAIVAAVILTAVVCTLPFWVVVLVILALF
jgi:hypothetical protein